MKKLVTLLAILGLAVSPLLQAGARSAADEKGILSDPSDYFRSAVSGNWNSISTWESSADNVNWVAATLTPTSGANTISIRNAHTVTVNSNENMDQVVIESGGVLIHSSNTLTVNDGAGDDIVVEGGGIWTLASNNNEPVFTGTAAARISTGGMLRLSATGLTDPGAGVHAANYIYQNASVLEYTPNLAFASSGVTFFPNVDAVTIPVFRTTSNLGLIGGGSPTVINGLYEANGTITFNNAGTKTFRNGIIGTGNISSTAASGKFIINGGSAILGGTGSITLPTAGMDIGSNTGVTMVSNKSVTGNIALLSNALVTLGTYDLTITGDITGGTATSHVVTNSTGKLVYNNITTTRIFPVGASATSINALAIANGEGFNYGVRVETGINPTILVPIYAVNRTWVVNPSATPAGTVNVDFFYNNTDGNASFMYAPSTVELGFYTSVWNVINTGLVQAGGPLNFQVAGTVNQFLANTDAPMVIGNIGAILAVNNVVLLTAQKRNSSVSLNWIATIASSPERFEVERSADGRSYALLAQISPGSFSFTDLQPLPGTNYYRVKRVEKDGKITYSNQAVILNAASGFELLDISPNPVTGSRLAPGISVAKNTWADIVIADIQGRILLRQQIQAVAGFNRPGLDIRNLKPGIYQLYVIAAAERSRALRFVVQ